MQTPSKTLTIVLHIPFYYTKHQTGTLYQTNFQVLLYDSHAKAAGGVYRRHYSRVIKQAGVFRVNSTFRTRSAQKLVADQVGLMEFGQVIQSLR